MIIIPTDNDHMSATNHKPLNQLLGDITTAVQSKVRVSSCVLSQANFLAVCDIILKFSLLRSCEYLNIVAVTFGISMYGLVKLEGLEEIEKVVLLKSCCLTNHRLLNFLAISSHQGRVREGTVQVFRR